MTPHFPGIEFNVYRVYDKKYIRYDAKRVYYD